MKWVMVIWLTLLVCLSLSPTRLSYNDDTTGSAEVIVPYPTYSDVGTNTTLIEEYCEFQILWTVTSGNLSWCGFTWNGTGTWSENETVWTDGENTTRWGNITKTLPTIVDTVVGYAWYCNDTSGNMANTPIFTLTTTEIEYATTDFALMTGLLGAVMMIPLIFAITESLNKRRERKFQAREYLG